MLFNEMDQKYKTSLMSHLCLLKGEGGFLEGHQRLVDVPVAMVIGCIHAG